MLRTHLYGERNIFVVAESIRAQADAPTDILGFAIAHVVGDEAEVLDIAVMPSQRGLGIGAALLDTLMGRCEAGGAETIFLEVRESNAPARALYASRHFALAGRRKRYYQLPTEDGLILRADLPVSTGNPA